MMADDDIAKVGQPIFITAEEARDDETRKDSLQMSTEDELGNANMEDQCNVRTTTPASDFHDFPDKRNDSDRFLMKIDQENNDLKAVTRFTSGKLTSSEPLKGVADLYPGYGRPRSFVINQLKPSPMAPLNVWRGYQGNVYFQPINIKKAGLRDPDELMSLPSLADCTTMLQNVISRSRLNADHLLQLRQRAEIPHIASRKKRINVTVKMKLPVFHMDKDYMADTNHLNAEYLHILQCQQSFGTLRALTSLNLNSKSHTNINEERNKFILNQGDLSVRSASSRLQRGSVARKLCTLRATVRSSAPPAQMREMNLDKTIIVKEETNKNNSSSLHSDIEMLYAKLPTLMSKVPRFT